MFISFDDTAFIVCCVCMYVHFFISFPLILVVYFVYFKNVCLNFSLYSFKLTWESVCCWCCCSCSCCCSWYFSCVISFVCYFFFCSLLSLSLVNGERLIFWLVLEFPRDSGHLFALLLCDSFVYSLVLCSETSLCKSVKFFSIFSVCVFVFVSSLLFYNNIAHNLSYMLMRFFNKRSRASCIYVYVCGSHSKTSK